MGQTPDQARLAVEAQRAQLDRTAAQLRDSLDVRKRFRENPAAVAAIGAGAVFLLAGGPMRVARLIRRRLFRSTPEKTYDALPKPLQTWVDTVAGGVGPRTAEAREALSAELTRWRHEPLKSKKARKELAKAMADGPPGPGRTGWKAAEAIATIVAAAAGRKLVERFLSGEPPIGIKPLDAVGTVGGAAEPDADHAKDDVTRPTAERRAAAAADAAGDRDAGRADYSSMSKRSREGR
ncbi:MAG TPA: hypothetical protein VFM19_01600 [Candidatus Limnocylindria bacterium]|nr:hypothetical protein [Candidatus Limnocylindria bacterium]